MAFHPYQSDPLALALNDHRLRPCPDKQHADPIVLDVDLELLGDNMRSVLQPVIRNNPCIQNFYSGFCKFKHIDATIKRDVDDMIDAALAVTYNRLRAVCQTHLLSDFPARMNECAPVSNRTEFPAFIASTLSKIGPLRIRDAAKDTLVIYATTADRMHTYGRKEAVTCGLGSYHHLLSAFRSANVRMAPIDFHQTGSYFTTIIPLAENHGIWTFKGTQHESHYCNDDIVRAFLALHHDAKLSPVGCVAEVVEECTDEAVVAAIAGARPAAAGVEADPETSQVKYIGLHYPTNVFGIRPAVAATATAAAIPAAVYIIGRGKKAVRLTILAQHIHKWELEGALGYRLFNPASEK